MTGQVGDYILRTPLGSGDMGTTHLAQHVGSEEYVAVKILDKVDASSKIQHEAAIEVIEFAATITHPQLHPIIEVIESPEGSLGIVMPLAGIGSVGSLLEKGKSITPKHGFNIVGQIAAGVQHLHDQEVAHGSLKPGNILLDKQGNATITDLSMAHLRELGLVPDEPSYEHHIYAPPEREYHAAPEIAGDVFSMAAVTYLLLTGAAPFTEPEQHARHGHIPQRNLPPTMIAVLRRAMNPHIRLRYQSLGEFMQAVKNATQGKVDEQTEKVFGVNAPPPD